MNVTKCFAFTTVLLLAFSFISAQSPDNTTNHSKLVYPGRDGRLVYMPDERGNTIPDFSYAGYGGGGVNLPDVPVEETVEPGDSDATTRIQAAIDRVSRMPLDKSGFRGAVLLKKGEYHLDDSIRIASSGIVLRGEGQGDDGTVLIGHKVFKDMTVPDKFNVAHFIIIEGKGGREEIPDTARKITDDYVPVGTQRFNVEHVEGLSVRDKIIVRRHGNQVWIREMGMEQENTQWSWKPEPIDFDRVITAIDGNTITVDAPLVCAVETKWGGGEVIRYEDPGRLKNVGVENIRGVSDFDLTVRRSDYGNINRSPFLAAEYYADEDHYWNFIYIENTCNAWVRDVTALHFAGGTVLSGNGTKWITIQDCTTREPVSFCAGWRRFTYHIRGQLSLVQRCFSDRGRHSFVLTGIKACGPNVFLDCEITRPFSSSEPHSHYCTGALYDNVIAPLTIRFWKEISIGWAGANCVLWNCEGQYLVQKPPTAQNYAIGHIGVHAMVFNTRYMDYGKDQGFIESWNRHVQPRSLYLMQLEERLGEKSLKNIGY
ncbi:hypothetical protein ACFL47_07240 [Candidatus Latescibacterota bacterium]